MQTKLTKEKVMFTEGYLIGLSENPKVPKEIRNDIEELYPELFTQTFYLTFGQKYPFRDGWVEVEAPDYVTARTYVIEIFGSQWSFLYAREDFKPELYPDGKLGKTIK